MKSLNQFITESILNESQDPPVAVYTFFRVNIRKQNEHGERIGDVDMLTRKYYFNKKWVFGKPRSKNDKDGLKNWIWAMSIPSKDIETQEGFYKFIDKKNSEDEFYQYFIDKKEAEKAANKAVSDYKSQKWTLETLCNELNKDKKLKNLGHNFQVTKTWQNKDPKNRQESIHINSTWRIRLINGKIILDNAHWHSYEVPNIESLYNVLLAEEHYHNSDDIETARQEYSELYND